MDCALLKLYLKNDEEGLYTLLKGPNSCVLEFCEEELLKHNV